jgi:hypothetical protein
VRRGQGLFKQRVRQVEVKCRITGVDRIEHLRYLAFHQERVFLEAKVGRR